MLVRISDEAKAHYFITPDQLCEHFITYLVAERDHGYVDIREAITQLTRYFATVCEMQMVFWDAISYIVIAAASRKELQWMVCVIIREN
jgi:hypothetical protein